MSDTKPEHSSPNRALNRARSGSARSNQAVSKCDQGTSNAPKCEPSLAASHPVAALTVNRMGTSAIRLLLVDDHPENLIALRSVFDEPGYDCVLAHSGREALSILLTNQDFSTILMDVHMPDLDGFETARLISEYEKTQDIPIIFITAAYTSTNDMLKGYALKAMDYVVKPFNEELLKRKVWVYSDFYRRAQQAKRELAQLKGMMQNGKSADALSPADVRSQASMAEEFQDLVGDYVRIIEQSLQEQAYDIEKTHQAWLTVLATKMGHLRAVPKDVINVHLTAMEQLRQQHVGAQLSRWSEEGRMLVLELMGDLVSFYRAQSGR